MINLFKILLFSITTLIIVAHNIIPHYHNSEISYEKHSEIHLNSEDSFFDYLAFLFHEYTEEGEIEDVITSEKNVFSFIKIYKTPILLVYQYVFNQEVLMISEQNYYAQIILETNSGFSKKLKVRPPPFISLEEFKVILV